jgi:hypothetical protein
MHPFLDRLFIPPQVQDFFYPFFYTDELGNLLFSYGDAVEHFGFAFHRVPVTENFWMAGNPNLSQVADVIICGTAMDAVAWLKKKYCSFPYLQNLLFLSVGAGLQQTHITWIYMRLKNKRFRLLFGRDILGRITDLKLAAGIKGAALEIYSDGNEGIVVHFRSKTFLFSQESFSLNAFEKASGFRFNLSCQKPCAHNSFFGELLADEGLLNH